MCSHRKWIDFLKDDHMIRKSDQEYMRLKQLLQSRVLIGIRMGILGKKSRDLIRIKLDQILGQELILINDLL